MVAAQVLRSPTFAVVGSSVAIRALIRAKYAVVELGRLAGLLVGVAHPPHHAALAGPPVDARRHVEDHRQPLGREVGVALGDHHLVARATGRDPDARPRRRRRPGVGPPVSTTRVVAMSPAEVRTPVTRPPSTTSPVNAVRSHTRTPAVKSAAV